MENEEKREIYYPWMDAQVPIIECIVYVDSETLDKLSKYLRQRFMFGASHSREIIASYFGHKSHASFSSAHFTSKTIGTPEIVAHRFETLKNCNSAPSVELLINDIREFLKGLNDAH